MISSVLDSKGCRHFNNKNINDTFKQFYIKLYTADQPEGASEKMESFLENLALPTISDAQKGELNAPMTKEEALLAL